MKSFLWYLLKWWLLGACGALLGIFAAVWLVIRWLSPGG
jgi:hypothetical protein